jgi:predicted AlkP superfamily phosphohydrolase/phosphomutase
LGNLEDSENQKKIESKIFFKENLYKGKYIDEAPDIILYAQESGYLAGSILGFGSNKVILNNFISSGHHRINGIFMAWGKNIIS